MHTCYSIFRKSGSGSVLTMLAVLSLGGCYSSGDGPALEARPQTINFPAPPAPNMDVNTTNASATSSSGLAVSFSSTTPSVCSVDSSTGLVTGKSTGVCTITANQSGDSHYAPAPPVARDISFSFSQTLAFGSAPILALYDLASVSATSSAGLPVSYGSSTPAVCSVNSSTGLVTALSTGTCSVTAVAGVLQASQNFTVSPPAGATLPGVPGGVTATAGNTPNTVSVRIGAVRSGGSAITGYAVVSIPAGISASGSTVPITVTCPGTCTGYAFSVAAVNATGTGGASAPAEVITAYNVVSTFDEPDTHPRDSIFRGTFTYNSTTGTVSDLRGSLSESMTGDPVIFPLPDYNMTWLPLTHQLSAVYDPALGGLLVTTFLQNSTNTLSANPAFGGTDGWSPGTGSGLYYGFPTNGPGGTGIPNPGNAYARIFVNTSDPAAALTQSQLDMLAYADCAPGGMMGATCMTGTAVNGYGTIGTMSGFPVSQVITKQP